MKHISEVWKLLKSCGTEEELEDTIGEIPNKFGMFTYERKNKNTVSVTQEYYDDGLEEYMWDTKDINIPVTEEDDDYDEVVDDYETMDPEEFLKKYL